MTTTRTYKIIEHFKSGKMVLMIYREPEMSIAAIYEANNLKGLLVNLLDNNYTFRLINKKGRRG